MKDKNKKPLHLGNYTGADQDYTPYPEYFPPQFYSLVSVVVDVGGESPGLVTLFKTIDTNGVDG